MGVRSDYRLDIAKIKEGLNSYQFDIQVPDTLEALDREIHAITGSIEVLIFRKEALFQSEIAVDGEIVGPCDRCSQENHVSFDGKQSYIFRLSDISFTRDDTTEDMIYLPSDETSLDLSDTIRETILLSIPTYIHCENGSAKNCDPAVIDLLEIEEEEDENNVWDILKDIDL